MTYGKNFSGQLYIQNLDWLSAVCPIVYHFLNTPDGHKALYQDGIFCEFAVFAQSELRTIPFAKGRIVWKRPEVDEMICQPAVAIAPTTPPNVERLVGEALTNLYVGLGRFWRGEKLSAQRFIQHYAVDRIVELAPFIEREQPGRKDVFAHERRFEQRYPQIAAQLPRFVLGYDHSCESALAILHFLEQQFDINQTMAAAIRQLSQPPN